MYTNRQHGPIHLVAMLALITTAACSDQSGSPTAPVSAAPPGTVRPDLLAEISFRPGPEGKLNAITISSLTISPTSLTIGGAGTAGTQATWTATIENPKRATLSNVTVQTYFRVYNPNGTLNAWRAAGGTLIRCSGYSFGFLPSGTCTITGTAIPSNDPNGSGFLVPDDELHNAKFEIELRQDAGSPSVKLLAKRATEVTLFYQFN